MRRAALWSICVATWLAGFVILADFGVTFWWRQLVFTLFVAGWVALGAARKP